MIKALDNSERMQPESLRIAALTQCFAWSSALLSELCAGAASPARAALSFARRLERKGLLHSALIDCQQVVLGTEPLCASSDVEYDIDRVAYILEKRFAGESRPVRIFWPSEGFATRYGSWMGAKRYPCPHKVSHDLIVTAVWLRLLKSAPQVALHAWRSERCLQALAGKHGTSGPKPDAAIVSGDEVRVAIEIGGNYSASWLRHHIDRFEQAGWEWEIW